MPKVRVLVVGASIAGPTPAYWLAKAGANVTIIERIPKVRTIGQNIDIRTAGVTVMRKMPDMEAAVRVKTTQMEGISFVNDNGQPYGTIKATEILICKKSHQLSLQSLRHRWYGEYGCETIFLPSSLGPEFSNSFRDSLLAPLPALINSSSRIMNGWLEDQKYCTSFAQSFALVYHE